jgi:hypothetical protein
MEDIHNRTVQRWHCLAVQNEDFLFAQVMPWPKQKQQKPQKHQCDQDTWHESEIDTNKLVSNIHQSSMPEVLNVKNCFRCSHMIHIKAKQTYK